MTNIAKLDKKLLLKWWPLGLIIVLLTASFIFGWYFDYSKPRGGAGWADQGIYKQASDRFAGFELPLKNQLHYAVGYPLMGAVGHIVSTADPFMAVSFGLLMTSATFSFLAVKQLFGTTWAVAFSILLFVWDGAARSFQYASDLFAVPWNNQVLFAAMAYFFWLLVCQSKKRPPLRLLVITSLVAGLTFLTREESILFVAPAVASWLFITKTPWQKWLLSFAIIAACFLPQILTKLQVLGSLSSGRNYSYGQISNHYLRPSQFYRNVWQTVIDSKHGNGPNPRRPALLQAAPWLWLSPIGIGIVLYSKRYSKGLKWFVIISLGLMVFYLSGANMSAHKLKFHCLRYISPGFIALNLSVIVVGREALIKIKEHNRKRLRAH